MPTWGHIQHMYSWWWVELSPETCRVKPMRRINAIVASCWIYFTIKIFALVRLRVVHLPPISCTYPYVSSCLCNIFAQTPIWLVTVLRHPTARHIVLIRDPPDIHVHVNVTIFYATEWYTMQLRSHIRQRLKCDGTRAETRFRLSAKRTSQFKSAGASIQSTTCRRAVHISLQDLGCSCKPVFCSHVTLTGYTIHSLVAPSLLPCVTVCHHISTGLYQTNHEYVCNAWMLCCHGVV